MGRFDPKYTDAQRDAILRATCEDGMSAAEAVAAAKAGKLYGLDPFDFNLRTAADYAAKERARRRGKALDDKQRGTVEQQLDAFAEKNVLAIEAQAALIRRKLKWTADDTELMRKLGQVAREMKGLIRGVPLTSSGKQNRDNASKAAPHTPSTTEPSAFTEGLLKGMGNEGQPDTPAQQTNGHTEPGADGHVLTHALPSPEASA